VPALFASSDITPLSPPLSIARLPRPEHMSTPQEHPSPSRCLLGTGTINLPRLRVLSISALRVDTHWLAPPPVLFARQANTLLLRALLSVYNALLGIIPLVMSLLVLLLLQDDM